ncbi:lactonase family protein [Maribacter sp. 2307ULW6-5]|uniref:lactonase family protein n=1 Tax=Maribacter sp. 2307ULW6-5 TaxID=3386275 RepID=UPI0039BD6925
MPLRFVLVFALVCLLHGCAKDTSKTLLFIGSFTEGKAAKGIQVHEFDVRTGALRLLHEVPNVINPSFLKVSPNGRFLFSVLESQMDSNGKVAAYGIDAKTGILEPINFQDTGGRNPAHLSIHPSGGHLVVSNYTDAGIAVFPINEAGSLLPKQQMLTFKDSSIVRGRQDAAHVHSTHFSPDGGSLFAQDLGADKIRVFKVVLDNKLELESRAAIAVKPGSGPRHFTFHPNGKFGYGISELSGKVRVYQYTDDNLIFLEDHSSYATNQEIYRAADIHISPDGKFLYTSNRGPKEDSIGIFSIDQNSGKLTLVGHEPTHGKHPRNFCLDPSGQFLLVANQFSNNVVVFKRDGQTGKLSKLPEDLEIKAPSTLQMLRYVADR